MVSKARLRDALEAIERERSHLRFDAELDPHALLHVAHELAARTGLTREVAMRVLEDAIGARPLPKRSNDGTRPTAMDIVPVSDE